MFNLKEKGFRVGTSLLQKVQTLIVGRLLVIFLLLIASWLWHNGALKFSFEDFPQSLFVAFIISVGLTVFYFLLLRFNKNYRWQIRAQFFIDAILITWLVWQTGDVSSPYITLYIVLIGVAGLFLKSNETLFTAAFSAFLLTGLSILSVLQMIPTFSAMPETSKAVQIIGFHFVAFLVVGLLSSKLADRYTSGEKLKETTKTLVSLQALHERIVESIRSGLVTIDLEGTIYTYNPAAVEITGFTADEMRGKDISELFGDISGHIQYMLENTISVDKQPRFVTDIFTPEGFVVHIGYNISPLFSEDGETTGLIITFQDLTEIRSMEENVRRKDRLAAVGRVAAGLAHEIRNPLGAMRGAIQVLESSTPPDSSQAKLMDIILRESDRLNRIITNFLTYARPRAANFSETDVREAISDTFTLLKHSPDVIDHHTLKAVLPEKPVFISADATQLKQIFWNLARNSLQAMSSGGVLEVKLENNLPNRIRIIFSDTGCGMSPEQVEKLFEPFSNSTTGGTGLGLSIVYQIVRDHGGTINIRSREGEGSFITVELPTDFKNDSFAIDEDEIENTVQPSRLEGFLNVR